MLRQLFSEVLEKYLPAIVSRRMAAAKASFGRGSELLAARDFENAVRHLVEAVRERPDYLDAYLLLGDALLNLRRFSPAIEAYRGALLLRSDVPEVHMSLGTALKECGDYDAAIGAFQSALALRPNYPGAWNNLGYTFQETGRSDEAISCFRMALSQRPEFLKAHSNLLLALCYHHGAQPEDVCVEHVRWAELHERPLVDSVKPHRNAPDPDRRLRVGYVSPDFRRHAVAHFITPVLAEHDHAAFNIYCYHNYEGQDRVTEILRGHADTWHEAANLTDDDFAALVMRDQIDILVDLAGHTLGNRLQVFARKPAPLQVTYLGYPATTGLATMDYRLTDALCDPIGISEPYCTEKLIRLPRSMWCFRPLHSGKTGVLPARTRGYVTFGSLNSFAKLNEGTLRLWTQLLRALPNSRLIIARVPEGDVRKRLQKIFGREGIGAERLEILGAGHSDESWESIQQRIDIALDSFPYNGTTTTLDAMHAGIPVVALVGKTHASRTAYSILSSAGLQHLASASPEGYLGIALQLAQDIDALAELRESLRARLEASVLMDARGFTRDLESVYRTIWRAWCERPSGQHASVTS